MTDEMFQDFSLTVVFSSDDSHPADTCVVSIALEFSLFRLHDRNFAEPPALSSGFQELLGL